MRQPRPAEHPLLSNFGRQPVSLLKVGGALGIAGTLLAILVFLAAIGFNAALMFAPLIALFGLAGLIFTVIGALRDQAQHEEETQPIAAMFVCALSLCAGLIEWMMY